jgi:hypothetical protein
VSFDELMAHAAAIQQKAIKRAVTNNETDPEYARGGVDGYYRDIPGLFRPFAEMPNPAAYQPLIDDLKIVLRKLSSGENQDPATIGDEVHRSRSVLVANRPALADGRGGTMTGPDQMGEAI